jgi:phosphonoacetate hydrolase
MNSSRRPTVTVHGRDYQLPQRPTVIVCVDGFDPEYLQAGCKANMLPTMAAFIQTGFHATAMCAMPSVTNPNNLCIITGASTSFHGISGNYYLDKVTGQEHMVLDDSNMLGTTILEQMADLGVRVAAITAKDKLRKIINHGLSPSKGSICFSAQHAKDCTETEHGIKDVEKWLGKPNPPQYSGDLSLFVLDAGVKLLKEKRADLFYLTLSDYVQHKYAPGSLEGDAFLKEIDDRLAEFVKLGAVVAVTGDHGMSDKCDDKGNPNVLYLEDALKIKWPELGVRVICPISDPFVRHHGALGGFVRVHLTKGSYPDVGVILDYCKGLPHVEVAYTGAEAASLFDMPPDREGDLVVISKENAVVGATKADHDLSQLQGFRLRSHGGLSEQAIPLLRSGPVEINGTNADRIWRNFDVFDIALNY